MEEGGWVGGRGVAASSRRWTRRSGTGTRGSSSRPGTPPTSPVSTPPLHGSILSNHQPPHSQPHTSKFDFASGRFFPSHAIAYLKCPRQSTSQAQRLWPSQKEIHPIAHPSVLKSVFLLGVTRGYFPPLFPLFSPHLFAFSFALFRV